MLARRPFFITLFIVMLLGSYFLRLTAQDQHLPADGGLSEAVDGKWLGVRKVAITPYVKRGEQAIFEIFVFNKSNNFSLEEVTVADDLTEDCARFIGRLEPDEGFGYRCSRENVQVPYTNAAVATGRNATNDQPDEASDTARVEVLELSTTVEAEPGVISSPGRIVSYALEIANLSSVDILLTALTSPQFGNLADPQNTQVSNNTCAPTGSLPLLAREGGTFGCAFDFNVSGSPGEQSFQIEATGSVTGGPTVSSSGTAVVKIVDVINTTLTPAASRIVAGGSLVLTAAVENVDDSDDLRIVALSDAVLGDITPYGDCMLPQVLAPGDSYECNYEQIVTGTAGDEQSYILTVNAETGTSPPVPLSDQASATVRVYAPELFLPVLTNIPRPTSCAAPLLVKTNTEYLFYPDTESAIYWIVLEEASTFSVELTNFVPQDGQVSVYRDTGNGCDPDTLEFLGNDGTSNRDRLLSIPEQEPGNYYIYVYSGDDTTDEIAYSLIVRTP